MKTCTFATILWDDFDMLAEWPNLTERFKKVGIEFVAGLNGSHCLIIIHKEKP